MAMLNNQRVYIYMVGFTNIILQCFTHIVNCNFSLAGMQRCFMGHRLSHGGGRRISRFNQI